MIPVLILTSMARQGIQFCGAKSFSSLITCPNFLIKFCKKAKASIANLRFVAPNKVVNVIGYEITIFVHNASKTVGYSLPEY